MTQSPRVPVMCSDFTRNRYCFYGDTNLFLSVAVADQGVLHQGAEETLSGLQQHWRLHLHMERHHVYSKAAAHKAKSSHTEVVEAGVEGIYFIDQVPDI